VVILKGNNYPIYISRSHYQALNWLKHNTAQDAVILSTSKTSILIPAFTARMVYLGHGHQTINWPEKLSFVDNFFFQTNNADDLKKEWLKK